MKSLYCIALFVASFAWASLSAQSSLDSIRTSLAQSQSSLDSLDRLQELCRLFYTGSTKNHDSLRIYSLMGYTMADDMNQDSIYIDLIGLHAISFFRKDTARYFQYMELAEQRAVAQMWPALASRYSYYQASRAINFNQTRRALRLLRRSIDYLDQAELSDTLTQKDLIMKSRMLSRTSTALLYLFDYEAALEASVLLREQARVTGEDFSIIEAQISFVDIYSSALQDSVISIDGDRRAYYESELRHSLDTLLSLTADSDNPKYITRHSYALSKYGDHYVSTGREDLALQSYRQARDIAAKHSSEYSHFQAL